MQIDIGHRPKRPVLPPSDTSIHESFVIARLPVQLLTEDASVRGDQLGTRTPGSSEHGLIGGELK